MKKINIYMNPMVHHIRDDGMTLVEIMIVVIIMAAIGTMVGVGVVPQWKKAQINTARTDAQSIRSAVQLYFLDHNKCPTSVKELQKGNYIDRSKRASDPWNQPFRIQCEGDEISVISNGPDKNPETEDDIQ